MRALVEHRADAACIIDSNHPLFEREGTIGPGALPVLARTPVYDHCNFTVMARDAESVPVRRFTGLLLGMSCTDERVRPLLDMEGLKRWMPGRTGNYGQLRTAVERFGTIDRFVRRLSARLNPNVSESMT